MDKWRSKKFAQKQSGYLSFLLIYTSFTLLAYQWPLFSVVFDTLNFTSGNNWINILAVLVIQICLILFLLSILSLFGTFILKIVSTLLLITNSAALYFMIEYNIEIDRSMIENILNTNPSETSQFFDLKLMLFIFFLGIFPALFFMSFKFRLPNIFKRILISGALCVQLLAVTFLLSSTWLWFDANASAFGSRVLPWSYLVNTLRYNDKRIESGRIVAKLPTGTFKKLDKANINTRQIVILVIGESARAMNFSWYGYQKDTNIYTRKAGFVPLDSSETCATYTRASLECILSVNGRDALDFEKTENLLSYLSRMGIKTIVRRNNTGLPNVKVNLFQSASDLYELCVAPGCIETELDEILLAGFEDLITNEDSIRTFITFHLSGSHGPRYNQKYRKEFEVFTPVCNDVRLKKCDDETLKNAYDNSLLYTDHLLATIAEIASKQKNAEVLILYTSDHGESLGEYNLYLHGAPKSVAPKEQLMVPFLLWMNDLYSNRIKSTQNVSPNYSIPAQDAIFHTVLGVFGINDGPYDASRDIFAGH